MPCLKTEINARFVVLVRWQKNIEEVFDYKGETLTIKDYVIYECPVCEESIVDSKTLEDTESSLIEFRRKVDNLLTPICSHSYRSMVKWLAGEHAWSILTEKARPLLDFYSFHSLYF